MSAPYSRMQFQLNPDIKKEFDRLTEDLSALTDRAVGDKIFRPVGGRTFALMLEGISHSFFMVWLQNPDPATVDRKVEVILDLFYGGALAQSSGGIRRT